MGKNQNTFAKIQRERQKKLKADEKRRRRLQRKVAGGTPTTESNEFAELDDDTKQLVDESPLANQMKSDDSLIKQEDF